MYERTYGKGRPRILTDNAPLSQRQARWYQNSQDNVIDLVTIPQAAFDNPMS